VKYELDWEGVRWCNLQYSNLRIIKILTGLSWEEIKLASPDKDAWHGRDFISTATKLGFNTSERFIKFDKNTDKPCIMRTKSDIKGYWWAWIYDGELVNNCWTFEEWQAEYPELKATSMPQIWI